MSILKFGFGVVIALLLSFQQSLQGYDTIAWNSDRRLSWKDFKGKVPQSNRAAATTASGITYRFSTSGTKDNIEVDFKIDTFFYPTKSWYQPELCDEVILSHEQLHFDISELYARKLRKRLSAATFTHKDVKAKVKEIYRQVNVELSDFQNKYDKETNFSRNRDQQMIWNKKIAEELRNSL